VLILSAQSSRESTVAIHLREECASVELVPLDDESPSSSGTSNTGESKGAPGGKVGGIVVGYVQAGCNLVSSKLFDSFGSSLFGLDRTVVCEAVL
jgi:hypothetical protein